MHWTGSFRDGMRKGHRGFVPIFSGGGGATGLPPPLCTKSLQHRGADFEHGARPDRL
jgi:hypothetical protein